MDQRRVPAEVQTRLARVATQLATNGGEPLSPERVVHLFGAALAGGSHCALTLLWSGRRSRTIATTDETADRLESVQRALGEGPSLGAERAAPRTGVTVEDLVPGGSWPAFAEWCLAETPVRSLLTVPLPLVGPGHAVLTCYATKPGAFGAADVEAATMLAPFARTAVQATLDRGDADRLRTALDSSRQVGTAIGIIMARRLVTSEQALRLLQEASRRTGQSLARLAADVTTHGDLPPCLCSSDSGHPTG